jgi:hypothetical protein
MTTNPEDIGNMRFYPPTSRTAYSSGHLILFSAVFTIFLLPAASALLAQTENISNNLDSEEAFQLLSQKRAMCGINSLYIFLRLHGVTLPFSTVENELKVNQLGHSMLDLRNCAVRAGVPCSVRQMTDKRRDIDRIVVPAIAYCPPSDSSGVGHFFIILNVSPTMVRCIDGTTTEIGDLPREHFFSRNFRGVILERTPDSSMYAIVGLPLFIVISVILYLLYRASAYRQSHKDAVVGVGKTDGVS